MDGLSDTERAVHVNRIAAWGYHDRRGSFADVLESEAALGREAAADAFKMGADRLMAELEERMRNVMVREADGTVHPL